MKIAYLLFAVMLFPSLGIAQINARGRFVEVTMHAKSLEHNLLGDSPDRKIKIYLPASYDTDPVRRFPVLYHLHGYSLHSVLDDWAGVFQDAADAFNTKNPLQQMIVVIPDGFSAVAGSFWMNSAVGGAWEDFVALELPEYIDAHYRTIASRAARAISGHSMGGFAALRMGELHSDRFSVVYAFSPCCSDFVGDMTSSNSAWRDVVQFQNLNDLRNAIDQNKFWPAALVAFAIAVSPDPNVPLKADLPYKLESGKLVPVADTIERWELAMPDHLVSNHIANLRSLNGLALDYGLEDQFTHIPMAANSFTQALERNRVPFYFESYHGDHNTGVPERVSTRLLPFVAEKLVFKRANK